MIDLGSAIEAILGANCADDAFGNLTKSTQDLGYNNAIFTLLTDHPSVGLTQFHGFATDYPEDWMKHYETAGYYEFDPVVQASFKSVLPFSWDDAMALQRRAPDLDEAQSQMGQRILNDAADAGFSGGIGVPIRSRFGELAGLGFAREHNSEGESYQKLAQINLLAGAFYDRYMGFFQAEDPVCYTSRERDVLSWSAEGKTDREIAIILGITPPTVRYHWANIFEKMNVTNKIQATCQAVRTGVISVQRFGI